MNPLPTLLFLHGWGFDSTCWDPLRSLLADWPQRSMDRNYFHGHFQGDREEYADQQSDEPDNSRFGRQIQTAHATQGAPADERIIVIGHSFGFLHALMSLIQPGDGHDRNRLALISINGFTRFSASSDFPHGVSPRVIDRMMTKLRSAPGAVVADFRQRCGWRTEPLDASLPASPSSPVSDATLDVERLLADLQMLKQGDGRAAYRAATQDAATPCLVLAGAQDAIVPAAMTQAAFPDQTIIWRENGDHLLPTSATDWCANQIRAFLQTLPVDAL